MINSSGVFWFCSCILNRPFGAFLSHLVAFSPWGLVYFEPLSSHLHLCIWQSISHTIHVISSCVPWIEPMTVALIEPFITVELQKLWKTREHWEIKIDNSKDKTKITPNLAKGRHVVEMESGIKQPILDLFFFSKIWIVEQLGNTHKKVTNFITFKTRVTTCPNIYVSSVFQLKSNFIILWCIMFEIVA